MNNGEPILGKARPDHRDHRPLTWPRFLRLRAWARRVATEHGVTIYLVGSALGKPRPRDLDVAVVWPVAEYVRLFGPIPPNSLDAQATNQPTPMALYLRHVHEVVGGTMFALCEPCFDQRRRIDIHYCPDTWWPERDRMLLAAPEQRAA